MNKKKKILLIGPMPPPSGGVSVHLRNLLARAAETGRVTAGVFDPGKKKLFRSGMKPAGIVQAILFFLRADILHIHISHPLKIVIGRIGFIFGKKIFYTHHNIHELGSDAVNTMMHLADTNILVFNPGRIEKALWKKTSVIPAYISFNDETPLPDKLINEIKNSRKIIVSVTSAKKNSDEDIYGFDLILKALPDESLKECLVILIDVNGIFEKKYSSELTATAIKILYVNHDINLTALLAQTDVFIRATRTDGDSVSVREALHAGANVLASDCVERPEGVRLFISGDSDSLRDELHSLLQSATRKIYPQKDYSDALFALYES